MFADQSIYAMLALPALGAALCLVLRRPRHVLATIVIVSAAEVAFAVNVWTEVLGGKGFVAAADEWFYIDAFSAFHIIVLVLVFVLSSAFAGVYFANETGDHPFTVPIARRFGALWLGALTAMMLVLVSNNLGIMWVGMEATTLLTAFLISLHPSRLSLEAMWKYLIICSIGIAFAFMGTLLAAAAVQSGGTVEAEGLFWTQLASPDARLDPTLMKFAFIFVLVGYGTKAGLAPIHSWLPDAHSQAPAPVSAMFSGFLLNTALYCIMRYVPAVRHALGGEFASGLLIFFGTLSILVAAGFIVFQRDAKRLLAYHSVEHLGIIALGYRARSHRRLRRAVPHAQPFDLQIPGVLRGGTARTEIRQPRDAQDLGRDPGRHVVGAGAVGQPADPHWRRSVLGLHERISAPAGDGGGRRVAAAGIVPRRRRRRFRVRAAASHRHGLRHAEPDRRAGPRRRDGMRDRHVGDGASAAAGAVDAAVPRASDRPRGRIRHRPAMTRFLATSNAVAVPAEAIPVVEIEGFRGEVLSAVAGGARLLLLTGLSRGHEGTRLLAALADDARGEIALGATVVTSAYPALTPECPAAHYFEREILEQWGVHPEGHPWPKPVRYPPGGPPIGAADFFKVSGPEIHEVAVGPVHAGVIEPGHFRFNCHGEQRHPSRDLAGLSASRRRAGIARRAAQGEHSPRRDARGRHQRGSRHRLLPEPRGARRHRMLAACPGAARGGAGTGTHRQSYRRSRRARGRRGISPGGGLLRPAARRRAQPYRGAVSAAGLGAAG